MHHVLPSSASRSLGVALALCAVGVASCEPELLIGELTCGPLLQDGGNAGAPAWEDETVPVPWSTGFEDGFCGYTESGGYCYAAGNAEFGLVSEPVHTGSMAVAFSLTEQQEAGERGSRCLSQGVLPVEARYGAWFYIPEGADSFLLWNLFHFDGRDGGPPHGLWDVSIDQEEDGTLRLYLFNFLSGEELFTSGRVVPLGRWFHVEVIWRRSDQADGRFELLQDGASLIALENIPTDDSVSARFYVGNLIRDMSPGPSVLYVDDVTIEPIAVPGGP
jgi:hypothetical protein